MSALLISILVACVPTIISLALAVIVQLHKSNVKVEMLSYQLEVERQLKEYVKTGDLKQELADLKKLIETLSKQVGDLQRDFDRTAPSIVEP